MERQAIIWPKYPDYTRDSRAVRGILKMRVLNSCSQNYNVSEITKNNKKDKKKMHWFLRYEDNIHRNRSHLAKLPHYYGDYGGAIFCY